MSVYLEINKISTANYIILLNLNYIKPGMSKNLSGTKLVKYNT